MDGNSAAIMCERESSDGAGAYPITPSTQMGEYWAEAAAAGHINISGRPLIFVEPEGEHAAASVTAGMSMTGLRATNFSSGQGIAYMHENLYAAVGKRLTYVLNIGCRAITKASLNVHAGHDDYHCVDDTGFFQVMAKDAQGVADLNIMAHRIAELALTPGIVGQDGFLTTHLIETRPDDIINTPTPAQKIIYGEKRRRIPELWDVDNPVSSGPVQNQDSYMQSVAAQRPYFFDHVQAITEDAFDDFYKLTGRRYDRVMTYRTDDAEYLILGQGSLIPTAEAVADWMREERGIKVGVVNLVMFRPFPGDLLSQVLKGRKGVAVLERTDQPLASDLPLMREIRATLSKSLENGRQENQGYAGIVFRVLRHGQPRPAARGRGRRDREHAAGRQAKAPVLPVDRIRPQRDDDPDAGGLQPAGAGRVPKGRGPGVARQRKPQPDAEGFDHGAPALGRWMGCDHDGQEPRDDALRPARLPH
jgi:pyruvate-ferredoxin/flavodoxin oxidoreductase